MTDKRPSDRAIAQAFYRQHEALLAEGCLNITVLTQSIIQDARELDATAAPVVVGEDIRMIRQLVWRIKNDGALLKMTDLEADCTHALPALERILTAALAAD